MGELRKLFSDRKYVCFLILLILSNMILYQNGQRETIEAIQEEDESWWREKRDENIEKFNKNKNDVNQQAENLLNVSLFSNPNSFSYKNILKTRKDYNRIANVSPININDTAVQTVITYNTIHLILFVLGIATVWGFFDERKKGLWPIIYGCRNGRLHLACSRIRLLILVLSVGTFVLYGSVLCLAFITYGGVESLTTSVQSIGILQNFLLPISVWQFLLYFYLLKVGTCLLSSLLIWAVASFIRNRNLAMLSLFVLYGMGWLIYRFLPIQSPLCLLRYLNPYFLINANEMVTSYLNFPVGPLIFNQRELIEVLILVLGVFFIGACLWINTKTYPVYVPNILERKLEAFLAWTRKGISKLNGFLLEFYKTLFVQRGFLVLIIFGYIFFQSLDFTTLMVSPKTQKLNAFYEEYTGKMDERSLAVLKKMDSEMNAVMEEYNHALSDYEGGKINESEKNSAEAKYYSYESELAMYDVLMKQKEYGDTLKQRGIDPWFVDATGFMELLGERNSLKRMENGMKAVVCIILLCAGLFAYERQSGMDYLLRVTKHGRRHLYFRKTLCALILTILVGIMAYGTELFNVIHDYSLRGLAAPLQNIEALSNVTIKLSIGEFLLFWYVTRFFILYVIALFVTSTSLFCKNIERAILLGFVSLPAAFATGVVEYMMFGSNRIRNTIILSFLFGILGLLSYWIGYKKWVDTQFTRRKNYVRG